MTVKQALKAIRETGCSANYSDGEYRVRLPNAGPGEGYFTDDAADAVATARVMVSAQRAMRLHYLRGGN